jgi:ABC-type sulfate/molybdate transport systems ATPase subunit
MLEVRIARSVGSLQLDVDLSVSAGTVLVAGPNGAGKTTLLHLILGISRPDAGRILLDGRLLFDGRVDVPAERRCLGYVPQDSALFPHLDVLGNVAFGLGHLPRAERRDRAGAWLTKLGVSDLGRRRIAALSGGERQRVALARSLARQPRALLLDEPFASLDPTARRELRISLRRWLAEWRLPALIVSHDPADASVADRIAVMERGRIVQQGTAGELRAAPVSDFVAGFAENQAT